MLLIDSPNVPEKVTPGTPTSATVADNVPAIPAGVTTKKPVPLVTSDDAAERDADVGGADPHDGRAVGAA